MKLGLHSGWLLIALGISAGIAVPCAAQKRQENKPPQQQRQQQRPQQSQAPTQERRQQQQDARRAQNERHNADQQNTNRPNNIAPANAAGGSANSLNRGNRPPNARSDFGQRPNFNAHRPPNTSSPRRFQDLTPEQKRSWEKFNRLPPQKQQEMKEAAIAWGKLTPEQQGHIKNEVLPKWKQLPSDRQRAIQNRLAVLKNMPESARNQHLNDPNFTRGMSEEDKAMLRDLSHMHLGAPDPPSE